MSNHPELFVIEDLLAKLKVPIEEAVIEEIEEDEEQESENSDLESEDAPLSVSKNKFSVLNIQDWTIKN